jgi:hypothetical protein
MAESLDDLMKQARTTGIPRSELLAIVESSLRAHYEGQHLKMAFVECSERDTIDLSRELQLATSMPVEPVQLDDLRASPGAYTDYDLIVTTFYHVAEVEEAMPELDGRTKIIAVQINPRPDILLEIARLHAGTRVGLVSKNQRTLLVVQGILNIYNPSLEARTWVADEHAMTLAKLVDWANVVVDTQSVHPLVIAQSSQVKTLTLHFQLEQQSIDYLRQAIVERLGVDGLGPEAGASPGSLAALLHRHAIGNRQLGAGNGEGGAMGAN